MEVAEGAGEPICLTQLYGFGVFKGRSLCVTRDQAARLHLKFKRMYVQRVEHESTQQQFKTRNVLRQVTGAVNNKVSEGRR